MSVRILLPTAFTKHTGGKKELESSAQNLPGLIADLETTFPELASHLKDENGQLRRFINVYVNDEDIRFLGNDTYEFKEGDEVMLIPSIAGGR
jgi:molybdopterin converting factor small subunit